MVEAWCDWGARRCVYGLCICTLDEDERCNRTVPSSWASRAEPRAS